MVYIDKSPFYRQAIAFMSDHDLRTLAPGRHVIDGDNLWVNIDESDLRPLSQARYEAHEKYIDLQVPLTAPEQYGVCPRSACLQPDGVYDAEHDIIFFADPVEPSAVRLLQPGEIIVFTPDEAHAPLIGSGRIRKAIFKIRVV